MNIVTQRCLIHENREAIARCPGCRQFFCRECVTEHEQKFVCAACLGKRTTPKKARLSPFGVLVPCLQIGAGLVVAWIFFYLLGELLIQLPIGIRGQFGPVGATQVISPLPFA